MISVLDVLPIILYLLGACLLVVLIVLGIHMIGTLKKVDRVIDNLDYKVNQLNGVFDLIDQSATFVNKISTSAISKITDTIMNLFHRKKRKDEEYE